MLITQHVSSGALLGRVLRRPVPAFLAGLASHYALDALPHWGHPKPPEQRGLSEGTLPVAVGDGLIGLGVLAALAVAAPRRHRLPVLAGIAGACLPDLDKPGELFFGRSPFPRRHDVWHTRIQDEAPDRLPRDVLLAAGSAVALWAGLRAERRLSAERRAAPARR
jgi:hypothetical protein